MQRFTLVLALALAGFLASPTQATPGDIPDEAILRSQLAALTAPIRSQEELEAHLVTRVSKDSPLDALSPKARAAFVDSLVFTEIGLASLRHDVLEGLAVLDAYKILGLFGWQDYAADVPGLIVVDGIDRMIRDGGIHPSSKCEIPDSDGGETEATVDGKCTGIRPECRATKHKCVTGEFGGFCDYVGWWAFGYVCDLCNCGW